MCRCVVIAACFVAALLVLPLSGSGQASTTPAAARALSLTRGEMRGGVTRDDGSGASPLLVREIVRQAVLIAARDELGLLTRDEVLGEPMTQRPISIGLI